MLRRLIRPFKNRLTKSSRPQRGEDDFNWVNYHQQYGKQLLDLQAEYTLQLSSGDYAFSDGELVRQRDILPLHPNHRLLYETILQLHPHSVIEAGCGGGDHLHNLGVLRSDIQLFGCDRSSGQLQILRDRHPELCATVLAFDLTMPHSALLPTAEICFTQAVIMHIQTAHSHLVALSNVFSMAEDTVILMENWTRHHFADDIYMLFSKRMIAWDNLRLYYRDSPEFNRPHLLIASKHELPYPPLTDYSTLEEPLRRTS